MANKINVLDNPYAEQTVNLSGRDYKLLLVFNTSNNSWYLTIKDTSDNILQSGIKILPNQNLTQLYQYKEIMTGGNLWCFRMKRSSNPIGRDNLGIDKVYELWWITTSEEEAQEYNGIIQL